MEELERTKQFGKEVVDLLRHQPHCRMPFSKFIPTYHHHFGRQCKLSHYGFTKLIELFEAIPDVLMVSVACMLFLLLCTRQCSATREFKQTFTGSFKAMHDDRITSSMYTA